ncbi:Acetyltransferase (GNAT) family protein [compost metagenome]
MEVTFIESIPKVEEYMLLIESTGWGGILEKGRTLLNCSLENSWYSISVYTKNNEIIGFGRVLSDGSLHALICDVIILPEYQGNGIGSELLQKLIMKCKQHNILMIQLFSAKEKYEFYEKHGFEKRPDHSPGMRLKPF